MPTRNINLTPEMDEFVNAKIEAGEYGSASEVLRAGLRALEKDEFEDKAKLEALKAAIIEGEQSGIAEDGVFDRLEAYANELIAVERKFGGQVPSLKQG